MLDPRIRRLRWLCRYIARWETNLTVARGERRALVGELRGEGHSLGWIAARSGLSKSGVARLVKD